MKRKKMARGVGAVAVVAVVAVTAAACGSSSTGGTKAGSGGGGSSTAAKGPVKVGMIYAQTGALAAYGAEYKEGFKVGLDYATHGTGAVDGHRIDVSWNDSAGKPTQAVSAAKTLIGQGDKILAGTVDSSVALQVGAVAAQNQVLDISGPAATDGITGLNKYTFRSGRQTYQDVKTAAASIGDPAGKSITVLAQNYAFGTANVTAVKSVLGGAGAKVDSVLVPLSATDYTPFAQKIKDAKPDLLYIAWAGTTITSLFNTLAQQGVFGSTTVVTGLANTATYGAYGDATGKTNFLSYYFPGAPNNAVNTALITGVKADGQTPDLFSPDGFVAAQMIVHAVQAADGDNVDKMVAALDGWTFQAPKGTETIRKGDHALLQPMYVAKLTGSGAAATPQLVKTIPADQVAPPATTS